MKWSIIIALCLAIFGFIPGMGLPGALVLITGQFVIEPIMQLGGQKVIALSGDRAWPAALLTTLIWPIFIPLSYWLCNRFYKQVHVQKRRIIFAGLLLSSAILTTAAVEVLARME